MPSAVARPLIVIGVLALCHACYSAYEFSSLAYLRTQPSAAGHPHSSPSGVAGIPLDISLETIVSVLAICVGIVSGAERLQPISWRIWAGQQERTSGGGGPYQGLEDRMGFVDIRAKRREFADWVRSQNDTQK